ncbi:MAG TPA: M20 family metallopeptidase, partial [Terriglobia bacterium]|nr:M20 family metallopeptidase [Terriglobia bacterium]
MDFRSLLSYCQNESDSMLRCLQEAVEIESPTHCEDAIGKMADFFASRFTSLGGQLQKHAHPRSGPAVTATFWTGKRGRKPILLLGHLDTVWDIGTLAHMPFRIRQGRAYGPGILDMKSGIVCGIWAIHALRALNLAPRSAVRFFLNPDEEAGSTAFRSRILAEGRRARACLVLEPAAGSGALKTSRKGVGEFCVTAHGRSAHAGINPAAGVNAINELARQILRVEQFARPRSGLTINAGAIEGGARPNVVPERASVRFDVRIPRAGDGAIIERRFYGLKPATPGARLEITGRINRPPMERRMAEGLFEQARQLGIELGLRLEEASTGGGSDGSFVAALGVPTLDGLGGV